MNLNEKHEQPYLLQEWIQWLSFWTVQILISWNLSRNCICRHSIFWRAPQNERLLVQLHHLNLLLVLILHSHGRYCCSHRGLGHGKLLQSRNWGSPAYSNLVFLKFYILSVERSLITWHQPHANHYDIEHYDHKYGRFSEGITTIHFRLPDRPNSNLIMI